jgi:hypothetical protein
MLDTGCSILDARYWMLDTGCLILDARYWMLDTGLPSEAEAKEGCSMFDARSKKQRSKKRTEYFRRTPKMEYPILRQAQDKL